MSYADTQPLPGYVAPTVPITAPVPVGTANGQTLRWNAGTQKWEPYVIPQDVPDGVNDGDLLTWDAAQGVWVTSADYFGDESNVAAPTANDDKRVLVYDDANNRWKFADMIVGGTPANPSGAV